MLSSLVSVLLLQVTLVSPVSGTGIGDALPTDLGAWHATSNTRFSAAQLSDFAPAADVAALNEFGFLGAQRRDYQQGAKKMTVEAIRMHDASGAFGVFTWYRHPDWRDEDAATPRRYQAAIGPDEAIVLRNGFCIRVTGYTLATGDVATLVKALPSLGNEPMPDLPKLLPVEGRVKSSEKYAFGPQVFAQKQMVSGIPAASLESALGFNMGAEAASAEYRLPGRPHMTLALIMYPTPQLAQKYAKSLAVTVAELHLTGVELRRTGTLLAVVSDAPRVSDADALLGRVRYDVNVTMDEAIPKVTVQSVVQMVLSIMTLCGILILFCVFSGLAYGGIRVLARRRYPGRVFDRDIDFIELHLSN